MIPYLLTRLGYSLLVLLGVVTLVFFLFHVMPSDPARLTMGQRTDAQTIENVRREMHLDKPVALRYLYYLRDLSPLSWHKEEEAARYGGLVLARWGQDQQLLAKWPYLGTSYRTKREVRVVLMEALPGTVLLAISAMLLACVGGMGLGVLAALKKGTWMDTGAIMASVAGISLPSFFGGLLIAYVFGYLLGDITGLSMTGSLWAYHPFEGKYLALENLLLPALALGIRPMAIITQLTRSSLLDVLHQDYIRTAYAKGLSRAQVVWRHGLPNALNPVVTAISGWFAELLAGSFFIEFIFGWKGIGKLTVEALDKFDFPLVMGSVLLSASLFIIIHWITEILYTLLDPRVRLPGRP